MFIFLYFDFIKKPKGGFVLAFSYPDILKWQKKQELMFKLVK
jgi:hypothetical protein